MLTLRQSALKWTNRILLEETGERNTDFIEAVKDAQMRISLILGRPEFGESYVRSVSYHILPRQVRVRLKENIRNSLNHLIYHFLLTNELEKAYSLCKILTEFDKSHYDHFLLFARMCHYRQEMGRTENCLTALYSRNNYIN